MEVLNLVSNFGNNRICEGGGVKSEDEDDLCENGFEQSLSIG